MPRAIPVATHASFGSDFNTGVAPNDKTEEGDNVDPPDSRGLGAIPLHTYQVRCLQIFSHACNLLQTFLT